jgi:hypothetical protein
VPEAAIVAPLEGSEAATIAITVAAVSEDDDKDKEIDAHTYRITLRALTGLV